jgi:transcriptional regulator with XRE-family HTH domain
VQVKKTDNPKNILGVNLRTMRKELGLTQADFAKSLGITGGYISDLERGLAMPSEPVVRQMETIFKINREFLFSSLGRPFYSVLRPPAPLPQLSLPPIAGTEFEQVAYIISAIPHLAELIEIRGKDEKRPSAVNYILLWNNGEEHYFPTRLSSDTAEHKAEIQQIREECWRGGTTLSCVDGSLDYPDPQNEGGKLNLLEELSYAADEDYLLRELEEYKKATGKQKVIIAAPERGENMLPDEQSHGISKMLIQAAVILESDTIYSNTLAATITALYRAVKTDNKAGRDWGEKHS